MTIHIDTFSAKATFDFKDNELATSGLECAEVVDKDDGDGRFRGQSNPILKKTLVDVHHNLSTLKNVSWLPGVGDIYNGTPGGGGGGEGIAISHPYESRHCLSPWPSSSLTRRGTPMLDKGRQPEGAKDTRRSALRRHCDFWDADQDGVIYPWDIFIGFRKLGFNIALCLWAAVTMAACSSYSTQKSFLPHPLFAIYLDNVNRNRHGSTTGAYDLDAELDTRRFDAIFEKYAKGKDYLTWRTMYGVWAGQCCANDFFGWFAGGLECGS
ncbi:hypothetical protein AA0120_g4579 [Alternaria tenuissima]|uniref:EF-hand domain-containing protein n=1 Tax=Alternaria tenuissima TaxID=119927 RepID=A0AB37W6E1_9PLEO|nr:hypothetical protein AA0115_g9570 [Alternaria tenuissima]RYN93695.1 hypothetical protein AA0120_g4579 [Alternaria tenuissima]